jgi:methylglutaconyl-CoA hydratase
LFLTGEQFNAAQAQQMGLLHKLATPGTLDEAVDHEIQLLLQAGPSAQMECKRLIQKLAGLSDDISQYTAELIAQIRISQEGQEGLAAFLDKRKPHWRSD